MKKNLTKADLSQFSGSEVWYRHGLNRKVVFTDGAKYLADEAGAYWLLDEIALAQWSAHLACQDFQVWTLKVRPDHTATLTCGDGNKRVLLTKELTFTDFPLDEVTLWYANHTIYLPSEH